MTQPQAPKSFLLNAAAFMVIIWGLSAARSFLIPLLLAALLAFAMAPVTRFLRRFRLPEWASVLLTTLLVVVPLGALIYAAISEIQKLLADWPSLQSSLTGLAGKVASSTWGQRLHLDAYLDPTTGPAGSIDKSIGAALTIAFGGMLKILSSGAVLLLVIAFAVMMLAARSHLHRAAKKALAAYKGKGSEHLADEMAKLVQVFISAKLGITAVSAAAGWLIMAAFGVPHALLLGLFYGLLTWIPAVGMITALIPPIAFSVAVGKSGGEILALTGVLMLAWAIQDHVLTPKWLGDRLKLNFLATYLALFGGGVLWGPWGVVLGVPILGFMRIVIGTFKELEPVAFLISEDEPAPKKAS